MSAWLLVSLMSLFLVLVFIRQRPMNRVALIDAAYRRGKRDAISELFNNSKVAGEF